MINDLKYAVTFPTNGISLTGDHSFQPGATAVSGRNGKGKSFIAEMIRYGLFGKKALRGPASDYKTLDMRLSFTVAGQDYLVLRGKREILADDPDDMPLAVGADAVNKKIVDILGFGLEVFDVVCAANQKESERLTRLTATKRKELIDDVVGLTAQESVEKACKDEANGLRRECDALSNALVVPVEPSRPAGYRPSREIASELNETKALVARREQLERIVAAVGRAPAAPAAPQPDLPGLETHETARVVIAARYDALLNSIKRIPDATFTRKQLDAAQALLDYDAEVKRRGVTPTYTVAQLNGFTAALDAQSRKVELVSCPNCQHDFHPGLSPEQEELLDVFVPLSPHQITGEHRAHENWTTPLAKPDGDRMSPEDIRSGLLALDRAAEKAAMHAELLTFVAVEDKSAELAEARKLNTEWAVYQQQMEHHRKQCDAALDAQTELKDLSVPKNTVADLDGAFVAARVYESQAEAYGATKERFDKLTTEIADKQVRAEGFAAGAKGLVEARRTLKAFLAPSLSRVASALIGQMTAAAERPLYAVVVDEDMEITVDGQDVSTFNGAHATMINLALRLALGQVLVSRVMPVFIGDEIDSDLDEANAQMLVDGLLALTDQLKQVVIISHKHLEGFDEEIIL